MFKYKIPGFLLFSLMFSLGASSQKITVNVFMAHKTASAGSDTIYYNFDRKLDWSDFHGEALVEVPWGAMTASGFSFNSQMNDDGGNIDITIGVFSFFTKHDSWKKPGISSDYHLEHEQHHFDITRLGAEKLVNEIKKADFTRNNYRKLLHSIFDKVYADNTALQHQYDLETKNSMDTQKQAEWNGRIAMEIKKLKMSVAIKEK